MFIRDQMPTLLAEFQSNFLWAEHDLWIVGDIDDANLFLFGA